jgi:peptide-methionine (R)-S-oxide reductase
MLGDIVSGRTFDPDDNLRRPIDTGGEVSDSRQNRTHAKRLSSSPIQPGFCRMGAPRTGGFSSARLLVIVSASVLLSSCNAPGAVEAVGHEPVRNALAGEDGVAVRKDKVIKSEAEWKKQLTPQQYHVAREKGTEIAFTGKLWNNHEDGVYKCVGCGNELFSSKAKFDSGTGWPSFTSAISNDSVEEHPDNMRQEVVCSKCDSHLGHVFLDGPEPTHLRYCINSCSLDFAKKESP